MKTITITAEPRQGLGKGPAGRMRRQGLLPAVVYGMGKEPEQFMLNTKNLARELNHQAGQTLLVNLEIGEQEGQLTLLRELQMDPLSNRLVHADFQRVARDQKLRTHIPIHYVGHAAGVDLGGVMDIVLREVEVECLPQDIPDGLEVNVSELQVNQSLHVSDLVFPENVTCLADPHQALVNVSIQRDEEPEAEVVEGEEAEAGKEEADND